MAANFLYNRLVQEFKTYPVLTRNDLLKFFRQYEPELNESTFTWRIYDLKRRNIIGDFKRGVYTLNNKTVFEPQPNDTIVQISKLINQQYDFHFSNIWDTIWLNDLIELQATSSLIILEIEKGLIESVFFSLKDNGFPEVFIKPDETVMNRYASESKHPIIIKPFISRSPTQLVLGAKVPALEKILVDLYCDDQIYFAFQGHQLTNIYRNAVTRYALNFSRLFTYAKRRSRENEIKDLLLKVMDKRLKEIIE